MKKEILKKIRTSKDYINVPNNEKIINRFFNESIFYIGEIRKIIKDEEELNKIYKSNEYYDNQIIKNMLEDWIIINVNKKLIIDKEIRHFLNNLSLYITPYICKKSNKY